MCIMSNSNIFGMRSEVLLRGAAAMVFAALITTSFANPYLEDDEALDELEDYSENNLDRFLQQAQEKRSSRTYMPMRRSCIRRGASCDHRQQDCCYNSTCRCNLWGSNCRCQRMGLFQKWGKK